MAELSVIVHIDYIKSGADPWVSTHKMPLSQYFPGNIKHLFSHEHFSSVTKLICVHFGVFTINDTEFLKYHVDTRLWKPNFLSKVVVLRCWNLKFCPFPYWLSEHFQNTFFGM